MEISVEILAPASAAWELPTGTSRWPEWGPLVSRVESAEQYIGPCSTGRVQTSIGVWPPFRVTEFVAGQRWGWEVASCISRHSEPPVNGPTWWGTITYHS